MDNIKEELEIYRTVAAMTGDTLYRYSVLNGDMEIFYGKSAMSKYGSTIKNFLDVLKNTGWLGETEQLVKEQLIQTFRTGEPGFFEYEIQMMNGIGAFHWNSITGKTVYDGNNNPQYIIGKMTDIDASRLVKTVASSDERIDPLTRVLNGTYLKKQLAKKCEELHGREGEAAIISVEGIRDLCINNPELTEDGILVNVTQCIKNEFSYNAEIGRIKYNEFCIVYFGEETSTEFVSQIEVLMQQIENIRMSGLSKKHINACCGIYAGVFEIGDEFEIIGKAQIALNTARFRGPGSVVKYSKEVEEIYNNTTGGAEESYINAKFDQKLIEKSLDIISETGNVNDAINLIFRNIGRQYGIDRIYIHEMNQATHTVEMTYNWIGDNNEYLKGRLSREQLISYEEFKKIYNNRDMIIVDDIDKVDTYPEYVDRMKAVALKSFVQCIFKGNLSAAGCVGFERYSVKKPWDKKEIKTFRLISKLIATFLLNMREYEDMLSANKHYETHDPVTGYFKFDEFMAEADKYIRKHRNAKLAVVYTSIKNFIHVNAEHGYETGDEVLKLFAHLFSKGEERFIMGCRVNADNFFALVNEYDAMGNRASKTTIDGLNTEFVMESAKICEGLNLSINSGISLITDTAIPLKKYLENAIEARDKAIKDDSITFFQV